MWRIKRGSSQRGIFSESLCKPPWIQGFCDSGPDRDGTGTVQGIVRSKRYNQTEIVKEKADENTVL